MVVAPWQHSTGAPFCYPTCPDDPAMENIPCDIAVEVEGEPYVGRFVVRGKTVVVTSKFGTRSAELGDAFPDTLARHLLRELIMDGLAHP
jgi:hypothetical protein